VTHKIAVFTRTSKVCDFIEQPCHPREVYFICAILMSNQIKKEREVFMSIRRCRGPICMEISGIVCKVYTKISRKKITFYT
jgi:hypothetical protein